MSRGRIFVLLLTLLVLNLSVVSCAGMTSQGPAEQKRPAENQKPATEETTQPALETPQKGMEQTAKEEQTK